MLQDIIIDLKNKEYDVWVDCLKILACFFVVIGHLFQSFAWSSIQNKSSVYMVFMSTIYLFHVPLFFVCSGYLYQKYTVMNTIKDWKNNLLHKAINLGIPYIVFSTVTWLLKEIMSTEVNLPNESNWIHTLLANPLSPYWFLASLLLMFIVPTFKNKVLLWIFFLMTIVLNIVGFKNNLITNIIIVRTVTYCCFFALGMALAYYKLEIDKIKLAPYIYLIGIILWPIVSICLIVNGYLKKPIDTGMGIVLCVLLIMFFMNIKIEETGNMRIRNISKYIFPIFLMHTLIAAPVRIILLKLGIDNLIIHTILGLGASIFGPVFIYEIYVRIGLDAAYKGFINRIESKICCKRGN